MSFIRDVRKGVCAIPLINIVPLAVALVPPAAFLPIMAGAWVAGVQVSFETTPILALSVVAFEMGWVALALTLFPVLAKRYPAPVKGKKMK